MEGRCGGCGDSTSSRQRALAASFGNWPGRGGARKLARELEGNPGATTQTPLLDEKAPLAPRPTQG